MTLRDILKELLYLACFVAFGVITTPYWIEYVDPSQKPQPLQSWQYMPEKFGMKTSQKIVHTIGGIDKRFGQAIAEEKQPAQAAYSPQSQKAVKKILDAANQGYAHAQNAMAERNRLGKGMPANEKEALDWLGKAARLGYVQAQLMLGYIYMGLDGGETRIDLSQTYFWWSKAAEQGNLAAIKGLSMLEQVMPLDTLVEARVLGNELSQTVEVKEEKKDEKGRSNSELLARASFKGDEAKVRLLLVQGADANAVDKDGRNIIINASWQGHTRILNLLLRYGAEADTPDFDGKTALIWAAINGHEKAAAYLIESGAYVDRQDIEGLTALHRSAWNDHPDVVAILIKAGANPYLKDNQGRTPEMLGKVEQNAQVVAMLADYKPDIKAPTADVVAIEAEDSDETEDWQEIGFVQNVVNEVKGLLGTVEKILKKGSSVFLGQIIITGDEAVADLVFADNSHMSVGPNSRVALDEFIYDESPENVVVDVNKGLFRYLSGILEKKAYKIKTPTSTMGIRGTAFDMIVEEDGKSTVAVNGGEVELSNLKGDSITIPPGLSSSIAPPPPGSTEQAPPSELAPPPKEFTDQFAAMDRLREGLPVGAWLALLLGFLFLVQIRFRGANPFTVTYAIFGSALVLASSYRLFII